MPYLRVGEGAEAVNLYYEVRGQTSGDQGCAEDEDNRPKVVLIMGFACTMGGWNPQLDELLAEDDFGRPATQTLLLDNRGVGRSSIPARRSAYSTTIMAMDVLCILEHLKWTKVHVVGHSMGGMVATRLAALAPERLASLTLISTTAGGSQAVPRSWRAVKYALQLANAKSAEDRAKVDLKLHFMKATLDEPDRKYGRTRRELLYEEYVEGSKRGGIGQPKDGFEGQLRAIWQHTVSSREAATIVSAQLPVLVLHGRHDILAMPQFGEQLARKLQAPCIMLEGAHFLTRERGPEVNQLIKHVVMHGRRLQDTRHLYLDINPLPQLKARVNSGSPGQASATSYVSPLDFEAPMGTPRHSPAVSRASSSTYLLAAASF
ncbi:alpha/beta-hydrolase [Coccomyxa subellipsoidea C-169]|uniref:Alpha/beta-hydrolase n=1 Tax=Coccomyxa subellipsoidea (strain C-169) TaxID=574566 RepID=I0YKU3_COCSC|nr:alpha/beta-hydrolase [Coccomyxa subellipsoidea C-169]EIE19012.1 alpha/beta-hydrolase [Coccomyxa subellipsoidea C-169]|eukprot:XP_005643556.1 alpha/beta-hydrolase [Coccomyxa subellipsoidea C-169]